MFKFTKKIKVVPEQYEIIKELAKELNEDEKGITYSLIEMGVMLLISSRKLTKDGDDMMEAVLKEIQDALDKDPDLIRMAQLIEKWWEAGQKTKPELN